MPEDLQDRIRACRVCAERFAATATAHEPRPVVWFRSGVRILIAGQAPGARVHEAGRPFFDSSGDRLREWLGIDAETFYDRDRVGILPMAFCFPGYDARKADLPPPRVCADTWHASAMQEIGEVPLLLPVGGYAFRYHLKDLRSVTDVVRDWRRHSPRVIPLPHPSWRNTAWLRKNPWFEAEVLPVLKASVQEVLS